MKEGENSSQMSYDIMMLPLSAADDVNNSDGKSGIFGRET